MRRTILSDAFAHHVWATQQLLDACTVLSPDQLAAGLPGTFGPILETLRHLVGADRSYLVALTGGAMPAVDTDTSGLPALRSIMEEDGDAWASLAATASDPDAVVVRYRDDGSESHARRGVRIAQALHHGTDHRSQVCTVLTTLGIDPPAIDVWDFADQDGRLAEMPAPPRGAD
jgi:uncharacterized damage-inducible protein DinB